MKRVLFVIKNMSLGGPATSLMNMLSLLKKNGHEIELFVMEHSGIFMNEAKEIVSILPENKLLAVCICAAERIKEYGFCGIFYRAVLSFHKKIIGQDTTRRKVFEVCARKLKGYDVVISYQESMTTDFAQYIPAFKKIAWVHTIYEKFTQNKTSQNVYSVYSKFDKIICVIGHGAKSFAKNQPTLADRIEVINNPLNTTSIIEKSKAESGIYKNKFCIVSVGRLSSEKQYDYCIEVAAKLISEGHNFKWYIIGDGDQKEVLREAIRKEDLEDIVILKGAMENPYPFIAQSDVLVIASSYEAQPMVANEALVLGVPVVSTNYDSAYEVIQNGENGLICENSSEALYSAVKELLANKELMLKLKKNAMAFSYDNQTVLNETVKLIYGEDYE